MNKTIKSAVLSSLLLTSAAALSAQTCDAYRIIVRNNSTDHFFIETANLDGAVLSPHAPQDLNKGKEIIFNVSGVTETLPVLTGTFSLHTLSVPKKDIKIRYTLTKNGEICAHAPIEQSGDVPVKISVENDQLVYTIAP